MKFRRIEIPFENRMTRTQTILGWIYLLMHVAVLPLLLGLLAEFTPDPMSEATANLIYYVVGIVFCLTVMHSFLRRAFDRLVDNLRLCILTMVMALLIDYALSGVAALLLLLVDGVVENPNNAEVLELVDQNSGAVKAIAIFLAPIVEEILFRGVVFGSIRPRSRLWAYVASIAAFSIYHVWEEGLTAAEVKAAVSRDAATLLYALQYIPVSYVLAWAYERSGSIWTNIFFHMGFNALSLFALNTLDKL